MLTVLDNYRCSSHPALMAQADLRYTCFLSYCHADNRSPGTQHDGSVRPGGRQWANWVVQLVETYPVPSTLAGTSGRRGMPVPHTLCPAFQDEKDLSAQPDLGDPIRRALDESRCLVVLCSPEAARSRYVTEEILYFQRHHSERPILALILSGEPNADDPKKLYDRIQPDDECFPLPLRTRIMPDGTHAEPLAPDFRIGRLDEGYTSSEAYREVMRARGELNDSEIERRTADYSKRLELARLKLIAGLLDVDMETLRRHEPAMVLAKAQAGRRRAVAAAVVALIVALALAILTTWALLEGQAARRAQKKALIATETARLNLYALHMRLIESSWSIDNADLVRELLDRHRSVAGEQDLRGFEWYFWDRRCNAELKSLGGHKSDVTTIAFSPDGRRLASGSGDPTIKIHDASSGQELMTLTGHTAAVCYVRFSPDGLRLASAGSDGAVKIWDAMRGNELLNVTAHAGCVQFSPNGQRLACTVGSDVLIADAQTGQEILRLRGVEKPAGPYDVSTVGYVNNDRGGTTMVAPKSVITFSSEGQKLASAQWEHSIKIWATDTGQELMTLVGHTLAVSDLAFSPNGRWLMSASFDRSIRIWDMVSGKLSYSHTASADTAYVGAAFSAHGRQIVAASVNRLVLLDFDPDQESVLTEFMSVRAPGRSTQNVALSPDLKRLVSWGSDRVAKVWDTQMGDGIVNFSRSAFGQGTDPTAVLLSPDGQAMALMRLDGVCRILDLETGKTLSILKPQRANANREPALAFSPDGQRLTVLANGECRIWNVKGERELISFKVEAWENGRLLFSPDGVRLATISEFGTLEMWDAATGNRIGRFHATHVEGLRQISFSPEGRFLSAVSTNTLKLWNAKSGEELELLHAYSRGVSCAVFGLDGKLLAAAATGDTITAFDLATTRPVLTFRGAAPGIARLQLSADGKRLASANTNGLAEVWDAETGQKLASFKGASTLVFSPDGRRLASDGALWDAVSGHRLMNLAGTPVGFSPDGRRLTCFGAGRPVIYWAAGSSQADASRVSVR
jgi:WD40 repeat protein